MTRKLASTQALVADLEQRLKDSEGLGVTSIVALEDELNQARSRNQELSIELENLQKEEVKRLNCWKKSLLTRSIN